MPARNTIIFRIEGMEQHANHLELSVFAKKIMAFQNFLNASLKETRENEVFFELVNISHSSPVTIECNARSRHPLIDEANCSRVINNINQALNWVSDGEAHRLSNPLLSAMEKLAVTDADKIGLSEIQIINGESEPSHVCQLNDRFRENMKKSRLDEERDVGTVDGKLEKINIHNGVNTFRIYSELSVMPYVDCKFPSELCEQAQSALGRYVSVLGECFYRPGAPFPYKVTVREMNILPPTADLPTLSDLYGIAPNATGGLSSEDFVRKLRDEWK